MEHWTLTPPTEEQISASYNGYFWTRSVIADATMDEDGIWPEIKLIEAVQIMWTFEKDNNHRALFHFSRSNKSIYLDELKPEDKIEWQVIEPPKGVDPNDC